MMRNTFVAIFLLLFFFCSCGRERKFVVGVSQCSEDIWRDKQNSELRMGAYCHENVDLRFAAADDNDERQVQQIDSLVKTGIDLLIVAPNQMSTISPAIDRAFDSGVPVIVFERKTTSQKYTAYMGADNYEMGRLMGEYVASRLQGRGRVVEVMGLQGSSPAIDRHRGFAEAIGNYPQISVVATLLGDWTEESAYRAVMECGETLSDVDFVFGQNDRMAMGAKRALREAGKLSPHTLFCGIDGLPGEEGGIRLVRDSLLDATYIYPTHGDKLLQLAVDILEGRPYAKEVKLMSALVTAENANVLLMQTEEIERQAAYLDELHDKASQWQEKLNYQRMMTTLSLCFVGLLVVAILYIYLYYRQRAKLNREREQLAQAKLDFYTQVSHQLRTPLTLVEGPLAQLADTQEMKKASESTAEMLAIVRRNSSHLTKLVNQILDAQTNQPEETAPLTPPKGGTPEETDESYKNYESHKTQTESPPLGGSEGGHTSLLIVDDNPDIRSYLRSILQGKYQVSEAPDGKAGLEVARETIPDLIVSDVMMPVMDGLEFCKQIKTDVATSHIPVILLTARAMSHNRIEGYESGADAYITKPFSPRLLLARVDNLLRSRRLLKDIFGSPTAPHFLEDRSQKLEDRSDPDQRFVEHFKQVIEARMGESELSVEDIAADMHMSRVQLYRKIKALTGLSPNEQLRKARLCRARQLLSEGSRSVSEIAYEVGFTTPSYFSKCFKEEFGITPNSQT